MRSKATDSKAQQRHPPPMDCHVASRLAMTARKGTAWRIIDTPYTLSLRGPKARGNPYGLEKVQGSAG